VRTKTLNTTARRAELEYHQNGRVGGLTNFRFIPPPIAVIRATLEKADAAGQRAQPKEWSRALAGRIVGASAPRRPRRLHEICGRQCPSLTKTVADFLEVAAVIVHFRNDWLAERTTLVPRPCHPHQISKREVVAPQAIYCADQAR
jgi:hypothetical protein